MRDNREHLEVDLPGFIVAATFGGDMGTTTPGVSSRREYYYNYFWEVEHLFETFGFSKSEALISLKEASLPTFTVNKETYTGSSLEYKFAKSVTWDDIKVSWYDSDGLAQYVREWRRQVWTPADGLNMVNDYKKQSILHHFLPTGKRDIAWTLFNSWPSVIRSGELTYTSSDVKLIEVTVTYDWAEEDTGESPHASFDTTGRPRFS